MVCARENSLPQENKFTLLLDDVPTESGAKTFSLRAKPVGDIPQALLEDANVREVLLAIRARRVPLFSLAILSGRTKAVDLVYDLVRHALRGSGHEVCQWETSTTRLRA